MKKSVMMICVTVVVSFFLVNALTAAEKGRMVTATGKVTAVDLQDKKITISAKSKRSYGQRQPLSEGSPFSVSGADAVVVSTITATVEKHTVIKVRGKAATLADISEGDTVTVRYLRFTNPFNLDLKEITKK